MEGLKQGLSVNVGRPESPRKNRCKTAARIIQSIALESETWRGDVNEEWRNPPNVHIYEEAQEEPGRREIRL